MATRLTGLTNAASFFCLLANHKCDLGRKGTPRTIFPSIGRLIVFVAAPEREWCHTAVAFAQPLPTGA